MEVTKAESGVAFEGAGFSDVKPCFWISSGAPTRALHVAFAAKTRKAADDLQAAAFAAGAKDNGPPGVRPHYHPNYYGAFVADPDGCVIYLLDGFPYWRNNYIIFNIIIYMRFAALNSAFAVCTQTNCIGYENQELQGCLQELPSLMPKRSIQESSWLV
jgi:hypothetical protein